MKRILPLLSLVLFAALSRAALSPETLTLTNCTALLLAVGTNAAAPQDLTDCGVLLYVGNTSTSQVFTRTVQVATSGTFTVAIKLPTITAASASGYQSSGATYAGISLAVTSGATRIDYRDEKRLYLRKRLQ